MKSKLTLACILFLWFLGPACAFWQSRDSNYNTAISSGVCSQATTFLARTSGLSGGQTTAYQNLICGMVTDGTWSLLDALYVFATNTTTTANLNLVSTSYGLTKVGTVTFTANAGYTPDGTTGYFTTGYNLSTAGGNVTLNSVTIGSCAISGTNLSITGSGAQDGGYNGLVIIPNTGGGATEAALNDDNYVSDSTATSSATGSYIVTRTASTTINFYHNGSLDSSIASTSSLLANSSMFIGAINYTGTATDFYSNELAYTFWGGGMTGTQVSNMRSRLETFLVAVGASGC